MKTFLSLLLLLAIAPAVHASSVSVPFVTTQSITIPGNSYTVDFDIQWACDDYPQNSAPGRIELVDGGGAVVTRIVASVYRPGNVSVSVTGAGSVTNTSFWVEIGRAHV